ncbi:MAG: 50S ribosomal protein L22 [Euryarchaeota archaeon]|nr:50S ribosomal protein L22 [Euryarchaeota archaeon]MBU4339454.1 50S ribosomal protein L22 [Euryarchaeota archaeon]MBU4454497.1 50S ribosomal protein L22 [Euryarchaeota archaeon]MCG2736555.1 50S ribosomal protein L22 [Candidatus Methanoperedenaceae archaeon]MDP3104587.1 50S ribosomal protein L22 [Candidatus Methanoperedens sp.]
MKLNYSIQPEPEKTSKAIGKELHISKKHAHEISSAIKGMKVNIARGFLEGVTELKQAVPYKRFVKDVPHKRGMCTGRYPQKAAKEFLKVLLNAENNARYKGLESDNLRIKLVNTKKGHTFRGSMPRAQGRATPKNHETVSVEMILEVQ